MKEKRLIDANVGGCYSARSNAAGFEALREAEAAPDEPIPTFPAITYHYYRIVGEWDGEGGATDWQIMEAQALAVQELAAAVGRWIERLPCSRPGVGFAHPITRHVERRVSRRHLRDG